jgi:AcrR family transcriptional regulator
MGPNAELSPNTIRLFPKKTKGEILTQSLVLFNEQTFSATTTAVIAAKSNVLEGSLWYHFNSKKDILSAHLDLFYETFQADYENYKQDNPFLIINSLINSYGVLWDFRYLFRDTFDHSLPKDPELLVKVHDVNNYIDEWAEKVIQHAKKIGILTFSNDDDVESVTEISLIIGRYWLDFSRKKYPGESNEFLRKKGINLLIKNFYPYFGEDIKQVMDLIYKSHK